MQALVPFVFSCLQDCLLPTVLFLPLDWNDSSGISLPSNMHRFSFPSTDFTSQEGRVRRHRCVPRFYAISFSHKTSRRWKEKGYDDVTGLRCQGSDPSSPQNGCYGITLFCLFSPTRNMLLPTSHYFLYDFVSHTKTHSQIAADSDSEKNEMLQDLFPFSQLSNCHIISLSQFASPSHKKIPTDTCV